MADEDFGFVAEQPATTPQARAPAQDDFGFVPEQASQQAQQPSWQTSGANAVKDFALGVPEAAMTAAESTYGLPLSGAAGLGTRVLNSLGITSKDPNEVSGAVANYLIHNPETDTAKTIIGALGLPAHWAGMGWDALKGEVGKRFGPDAEQFMGTAGDTAADFAKVAGAAKVAPAIVRGTREAITGNAAGAPEQLATKAPDDIAREAGYHIPATLDQNASASAKALDVLTNSRANIREAAVQARDVTKNIIRQETGLSPDQVVNDETLEGKKGPWNQKYNDIASSIQKFDRSDPALIADIRNAGQGYGSDVKPSAAVETQREHLLDLAASGKSATGDEALKTISEYRFSGFKAMQSDDPNVVADGLARLDFANAYEAQLERQLQGTKLYPDFLEARRNLAKINTAQAALNGENVDAIAIGKMAKKNPGIDGGMRVIATMAQNHPELMRASAGNFGVGEAVHTGLPIGLGYGLGHAAFGPEGGYIGMAALPAAQIVGRRLADLAGRYGKGNESLLAANPRVSYLYKPDYSFPATGDPAIEHARGGLHQLAMRYGVR